jgi:hypothetical protein
MFSVQGRVSQNAILELRALGLLVCRPGPSQRIVLPSFRNKKHAQKSKPVKHRKTNEAANPYIM